MSSSPPADLSIRLATVDDLPAINAIYNHYVVDSTCTYQEEPDTLADRQAWFTRHGPVHPVTVAVHQDKVVGWGSLSPFHPRSAYRYTVENSIYLHPDHRGKDIGGALLDDLIARAKALGHRSLVALIDAHQPASIAVHRARGFVDAGHLRQVGFKFGRWLDVVYMQLILSVQD